MALINPVNACTVPFPGDSAFYGFDIETFIPIALVATVIIAMLGTALAFIYVWYTQAPRKANTILIKYVDDAILMNLVTGEYQVIDLVNGDSRYVTRGGIRSHTGNDQDAHMDNPQRRGRQDGDDGGRDHRRGRSIDDLADQFERLDMRHPGQRERDEQRRLAAQCHYMGWFRADRWDDPDAITVKGWVYRRCRSDISTTGPGNMRCHVHRDKEDQDPKDPSKTGEQDPKKPERKYKGLQPEDCGVKPAGRKKA